VQREAVHLQTRDLNRRGVLQDPVSAQRHRVPRRARDDTGAHSTGFRIIRQCISVRGVMLLELDRLSILEEAERVSRAVSTHAKKLLDHLAVIEPSRVRMRRLPR
jgi:hypothetical protein